MSNKHDARYWLDRLNEDCNKLPEDKKIDLVKNFLMYGIPLQGYEAKFFIEENPNSGDPDKLMRYSNIEAKVARAFNVSFDSEYELFHDEKLRDVFSFRFREILDDFYTKEELDEILSYGGDEDIVISRLVGYEHPVWRKIRNAYLPGMTTLLSVNKDGVKDITPILFDGEEDAVDQIERILDIKKNKE